MLSLPLKEICYLNNMVFIVTWVFYGIYSSIIFTLFGKNFLEITLSPNFLPSKYKLLS